MWDESIPDLVDDLFENNGPHGGPKETAMIQHLHPELVHEDRLEEARDGGVLMEELEDHEPTGEDAGRRRGYVHGARTFYDARDNTDNGVLGDQTDATAEKGAELFEAATDQLVRLCEWLAARDPTELKPKPHI